MKKNSVFFSILIPVYNVEKYLLECLESAIQQNYSEYEIIIIDDGSTDKSINIIKQVSKYNKRIRYYQQENQGLILTRRSLLKYAKGDYLLFLDSDDYLEKNTLSYLNEKIESFNADLLIFKYKRFSEEKNEEAFNVFKDEKLFDQFNKKELIEKMASSSVLNNLVCKVFKKELIDFENDYYEYKTLKNGEDLLQSIPIVFAAKKIIYLDKALYNYRVNDDSITSKLNFNFFEDITIVRKNLYEYIKNNNMDTIELLKKFQNFYLNSVLEFLIVLEGSNISNIEKKMYMKKIIDNEFFVKMLRNCSIKNIKMKNKLTFIILKTNVLYSISVLRFFLCLINMITIVKKNIKSKMKK